MAKWFGAHYNQEARFSSAVKCKKGPQVRCLIKDEIIIIVINFLNNFQLHLLQDAAPPVRIRAVSTITSVLAFVRPVPPSDANIFPEYLLPALAPLAQDSVVLVRCAFAASLADLAETALR